jgi:Ca2+-binding RTX toxin-like protein
MAIYESLSRGDRYSTENTNETLSLEEQRVSDGLNAADAQLSPTRLAFVEGTFDPRSGPGHEIVFEGTFTYEVDGLGAATAAHGTVTACKIFEFDYSGGPYGYFTWWGYTLSEVSFDLDLILSLDARTLTELIFAGDDLVKGTPFRDGLYGFAGNDELVGGDGYDRLNGGGGADTMSGGRRNDHYYVDDAQDVVVELAAEGRGDTVHSSVEMTLPDHVENLELLGRAAIAGTGNRADNEILGNAGNNVLAARNGTDTLRGRGGEDTLEGGAGTDLMWGGPGADVFRYARPTDSMDSSADQICDFVHGFDRVDLSLLDADAGTARNDSFVFIGGSSFSSDASGQLRFIYNSATNTGTLWASVDADRQPEIVIKLPGVQTLTAADLTL